MAELQHQEIKWGPNKEQSVPGYLLIMRKELAEAENGWMKSVEGRDSVLSEIVQVAATAISCLNEYGTSGCPRATNDVVDRPSVNVSLSKEDRNALAAHDTYAHAKRLYQLYTDNHPTMHSNRFASWEELSPRQKDEWILKAHRG